MLPANAVASPHTETKIDGKAAIEVVYTLSEAGRKLSILTGGNGRRFQFVIVPATEELLRLATVTETGEAYIFLNPHIPNDVNVLGSEHGWDLVKMAQAGFQFPCPRRMSVVECINFQYTAQLVPLDYKSPTVQPVSFDFEMPFSTDALLAYLLDLNRYHIKSLEEDIAVAEWKQKEYDKTLRKERLFGGAKLSEWLVSPGLLGEKASVELPDGSSYVFLQQQDENNLRVLLDSTNLSVFIKENDRRRKAQLDLENETLRQIARENKEKEEAAIEERKVWIQNFGSRRLQAALATGLLNPMKTVYNEERIAHDIGPAWLAHNQLRAGRVENDVLNPVLAHLEELLECQNKWPQCNVRLRSTRALATYASSTPVWRVTLLMEAPWDNNLTLIRFLTDGDR